MKFSQEYQELGELAHKVGKKIKSKVLKMNKMNLIVSRDFHDEEDMQELIEVIAKHRDKLTVGKYVALAMMKNDAMALMLKKVPESKDEKDLLNKISQYQNDLYTIVVSPDLTIDRKDAITVDFMVGGDVDTNTRTGMKDFPYIIDAIKWIIKNTPKYSDVKFIKYFGTSNARNRMYKILGQYIGYVLEYTKNGEGIIKLDKDFTEEEIKKIVQKQMLTRTIQRLLNRTAAPVKKVVDLTVANLMQTEPKLRRIREAAKEAVKELNDIYDNK